MGGDEDEPGAPLCTGPKQEEGTDIGRGWSSVLGGRGRGDGCGAQRGREKKSLRKSLGELEGQ